MGRVKIAVVNSKSFGLYTDAVQRLERVGEVARIEVPKDIGGGELAARLDGYHFIIASVTPRYGREFFERNGSVVMIVRHGIGYDNIDVKAAEEHGVIVSRVPGWREREAVAEYTVALMLSALRFVVQASNKVREGRWGERARFIGGELKNLTVGLVGFGNIGFRVATILRSGFGADVAVYDPYIPKQKIEEAGFRHYSDLCELLKVSDIVTLHATLTQENYHMIGAREFECMKDGVVIVNTARGELIDTQQLIKYVEAGKVSTAALDVVEGEPIGRDHQLLKHENIIVTPHIAAYTWEAVKGMDDAMVEAVVNYLSGKPLDGVVVMPSNPRKLPPDTTFTLPS
ncbi:MAG: D-isomer specific 2-hydroxyacid dehydrogenase family protein [Zestosphaera sp.]